MVNPTSAFHFTPAVLHFATGVEPVQKNYGIYSTYKYIYSIYAYIGISINAGSVVVRVIASQ